MHVHNSISIIHLDFILYTYNAEFKIPYTISTQIYYIGIMVLYKIIYKII